MLFGQIEPTDGNVHAVQKVQKPRDIQHTIRETPCTDRVIRSHHPRHAAYPRPVRMVIVGLQVRRRLAFGFGASAADQIQSRCEGLLAPVAQGLS